jgi:sugar lactone lactonase YvrE
MNEHAGRAPLGVLTAAARWLRLPLAAALVASACVLIHTVPASVQAAGKLQVVAVVGGQPDDITSDAHGRLVWGDLAHGTMNRLDGKHLVKIASNISVPEGIVALGDGSFIVAAQGRDRLVRVGTNGSRSLVYPLQPVAGQEGVDGIGRDPRTGRLLVPDSPNGTVMTMTIKGAGVHTIARGLGRPVAAAADRQGDVLVPDEHLGTLVEITPRGQVSYRGSLSTPDDVAVAANDHVWITTLGDGGLWEMVPGGSPQRVLVGLANPQGLTLDRCGDPVIVEQNAARIVRLLLTPAAGRCRF